MYTIMQSKRASPWAYGWLCFDAAMLHRGNASITATCARSTDDDFAACPAAAALDDFGTTAVLDSWCGDRFDARVLFGFKEMYCDSLEYGDDSTATTTQETARQCT